MQLFKCTHCNQPVYFDNYFCTSCHHQLGFDVQQMAMVALTPLENEQVLEEARTQKKYKYCQNHQFNVCNWVLAHDHDSDFCQACVLNRVIPDVSNPEYLQRWHKIELAKHRLVYAILRWNLPLVSKYQDQDYGLAFDFKADPQIPNAPKVMTGHDNGLITLNIAEADDVERAMARDQMDEVYRTVLGHFRHEIGHYYWDVLVDQSDFLESFRALFGDERLDYQEALDRHYHNGPPDNWMESFISSYATMHPWEDWAETWAHYLHMIDVLETADSFGLSLKPKVVQEHAYHSMNLMETLEPYQHENFEDIYQSWLAVSFAMNSLNRSMGHGDFYPFVINTQVKQKMQFIHQVIGSAHST